MNAITPTPAVEPGTGTPAGLADGIYFGLDEDTYHADPALGSTDLKRLRSSGPDYWWNSGFNPLKEDEDKDTPSRLFGRALHKVVLEGRAPFDALYWREPTGPEVLVTDDDVSRWLKGRGVEKVPRSKAEKVALALSMDPDVLVLDAIKADAAEKGVTILKERVFDRVVLAGAHITRNPELATAFQNGYSEVSVFWTQELEGGFRVRLKARFDYLKAGGIGDLKSIRNSRDLEFPEACVRAIEEYRYYVQAAHYLNGLSQFPRLVGAGLVQGKVDAKWLDRVAERAAKLPAASAPGAGDEDRAGAPGFAWVFYQAEGAPLTWGTSLFPWNRPILDFAEARIAQALENYRRFMTEFGPSQVWVIAEPIRELDVSDFPAWAFR